MHNCYFTWEKFSFVNIDPSEILVYCATHRTDLRLSDSLNSSFCQRIPPGLSLFVPSWTHGPLLTSYTKIYWYETLLSFLSCDGYIYENFLLNHIPHFMINMIWTSWQKISASTAFAPIVVCSLHKVLTDKLCHIYCTYNVKKMSGPVLYPSVTCPADGWFRKNSDLFRDHTIRVLLTILQDLTRVIPKVPSSFSSQSAHNHIHYELSISLRVM
jgi:hypothetical protein